MSRLCCTGCSHEASLRLHSRTIVAVWSDEMYVVLAQRVSAWVDGRVSARGDKRVSARGNKRVLPRGDRRVSSRGDKRVSARGCRQKVMPGNRSMQTCRAV